MIEFTPNIGKIIEALLWIVNKRRGIDVYHVMKIMFAADCYHLSRFGRPITGDYYVAVNHGTMPSIMKNIIDGDPWARRKYHVNEPVVSRKGNDLFAERDFDRRKFSKSDIEALEYGFLEYADILEFGEVRAKNHKHRAWIKAAERGGYDISADTDFEKLHQLVDFADMIDNPEILSDLNDLDEWTKRMVI